MVYSSIVAYRAETWQWENLLATCLPVFASSKNATELYFLRRTKSTWLNLSLSLKLLLIYSSQKVDF
jgi:hypothetical protein